MKTISDKLDKKILKDIEDFKKNLSKNVNEHYNEEEYLNSLTVIKTKYFSTVILEDMPVVKEFLGALEEAYTLIRSKLIEEKVDVSEYSETIRNKRE